MSATIDRLMFANYFAQPIGGELQDAPNYDIPDRIHKVDDYYIEELGSLGNVSLITCIKRIRRTTHTGILTMIMALSVNSILTCVMNNCRVMKSIFKVHPCFRKG